MRINVRARPRAQENKIEKIDEHNFVISVTAPPIQGRANAAIVKLLADHFRVAPSQIKLISGFTSRQKVLEIG